MLHNVPAQTRTFQSVIQFAPGARSESLPAGYQIDGASNSENAYMVEGQETASVFDGHSAANVPIEFIQEVQVKTSGFEAEYGGALGGVVNVSRSAEAMPGMAAYSTISRVMLWTQHRTESCGRIRIPRWLDNLTRHRSITNQRRTTIGSTRLDLNLAAISSKIACGSSEALLHSTTTPPAPSTLPTIRRAARP